VLNVPAWRTHRERHRHGPGKTDPGDAIAVAQVVLRKRAELGPALEPELVRALALLELQRRRLVRDRTQAIQRLRADWNQVDPVGEARVVNLTRERELRRLKRISFGDGLVERVAARCIRDLASDIDDLNQRIAVLDHEIAELLAEHGNPVDDLHGAGTQIAAAVIAHAGDVRRFRDAAAFARFCGAAPIPCGSGQSAGRHRLHRGGNRQLNAALYRIAIVQARHHPPARTYLARKVAEGKTPREARRALKRHLANVIYRRLYAWAEATPALNT
jgi:transposase